MYWLVGEEIVVIGFICNCEFLKYLKVIFDKEFVKECWKLLYFFDDFLNLKFGYNKYLFLFKIFCKFLFIFEIFFIWFLSLFLFFCFFECWVKIKIYFEKKSWLNVEIIFFRNFIFFWLYFVKGYIKVKVLKFFFFV